MSNAYGLFWNSNNDDRLYDADSFEEWLKPFFKSGVFINSLAVSSTGTMAVTVAPGSAFLDGKLRTFDTETSLTIAVANSTYPRIDNIVVERNDTDRQIALKIVQGKYSGTSPAASDPVRVGGVYQLVLAHISVPAGATKINASDITDTRASSLCGYVSNVIESPDFASWYTHNENQFAEWFEKMKGQLSADATGKLQTEIDALGSMVLTFTDQTLDFSKAVADATYTYYPYHVDLELSGCTADYIPDVYLSAPSSLINDICQTGAGYVRFYVTANSGTVAIPVIRLTKGGE